MSNRIIPTDEYGDPEVDYDTLVVEALGEWHSQSDFGYYQGDYLYIFRDGGRVGYLVVGYGSCSGCDALQDLISYSSLPDDLNDERYQAIAKGLDKMVAEFRQNVRWFDSEDELVAEVYAGDGNFWYYHEADFKEAMRRALAGENVDHE